MRFSSGRCRLKSQKMCPKPTKLFVASEARRNSFACRDRKACSTSDGQAGKSIWTQRKHVVTRIAVVKVNGTDEECHSERAELPTDGLVQGFCKCLAFRSWVLQRIWLTKVKSISRSILTITLSDSNVASLLKDCGRRTICRAGTGSRRRRLTGGRSGRNDVDTTDVSDMRIERTFKQTLLSRSCTCNQQWN